MQGAEEGFGYNIIVVMFIDSSDKYDVQIKYNNII